MMNEKNVFVGCLRSGGRHSEVMHELTLNEFLERVKNGYWRGWTNELRRCQWKGEKERMRLLQEKMPVYYPSLVPPGEGESEVALNGIAVVTMSCPSATVTVEALAHLREWSFVKGYFTNVRGTVVVLVWIGDDFMTAKDFCERRDERVRLMNKVLKDVLFRARKRALRGVWVAYDPDAYDANSRK